MAKFNGKIIAVSYLLKKTLLGLADMVKAASETWPNPRVKVNSTLAWSFQRNKSAAARWIA